MKNLLRHHHVREILVYPLLHDEKLEHRHHEDPLERSKNMF